MNITAAQTIADMLRDQGARFPNAGALLVLSALKTAGIAVIELPEPVPGWHYTCEDDGGPPDHNSFGAHFVEFVVTTWGHPGEVQISYRGEPLEPINSTEARALAASLLAAAQAAEETP